MTSFWQLSVMIARLAALVSFPTLCSHAQIDQRIREIFDPEQPDPSLRESLWQFNAILWECFPQKSLETIGPPCI